MGVLTVKERSENDYDNLSIVIVVYEEGAFVVLDHFLKGL
jgi:hypothetical protein